MPRVWDSLLARIGRKSAGTRPSDDHPDAGDRVQGPLSPNWVLEAKRTLRRLKRSPAKTVVPGPWTSEVGYELLCWVPFLAHAVHGDPTLRERLVVISRGGPRSWYRSISDRYVDILETMSAEEFRRRRETEIAANDGHQKKFDESSFDLEIVDRVTRELSLDEVATLHPSVMYRAMWQLHVRRFNEPYSKMFRYRPIQLPVQSPVPLSLPDRYVAARFYFRPSFPDTPENRQFVSKVLAGIAAREHVVLMNTGIEIDQHPDLVPASCDRIIRLESAMSASNNLEVQTYVVSRARAFVGTYGGLSYLPPFLGVPSLALYSTMQFSAYHLELAQRLFREQSLGGFLVIGTREVDLLRLV